jgi:hypothetical protein
MKEILCKQNSLQLLAKFLLLRYEVSVLVITRKLMWMDQELLELRWEMPNTSVMVAVLGTPCTIP